jgi:ornithine cyclodeaminase
VNIPTISESRSPRVITPQVAVDAIREAFRADGDGAPHVPAVINLDVPKHRGEFHVKTALIDGVPHVAVKIASGFYDNPTIGLPSSSGLMAVFDATTGLPVALLLDNGFLTDIRTGAAGAVAAEVLAPAAFATVGVLGSGLQARHQVQCLRRVRSVSRVVAWSLNRARLDAYVREMRDEGLDAHAAARRKRSAARRTC